MSQTATDGAATEGMETAQAEENSFDEYDLDYTGDETSGMDETVAGEQGGDDNPNPDQNLGQVPQEGAGSEPSASAEPGQEQATGQVSDVEALQAKVNELMGIISQHEQQKLLNTPPAQAAKAQAAQEQGQPSPGSQQAQSVFQPPMPGQVTNLDFLGGLKDQEYVDFLSDPSKFNEMLNKVATVTYNAAVTSAQEQIMMRIPQLVQSAAQQQMSINNITQQFYEQNADLKNFRQAVSMAAVQLYNENPKLQLPELLAGAAKRTREMLHLTQAQPGGGRKRRPAQPAGGSVRSSVPGRQQVGQEPELTDQQKQIMDLLNF